MWWEDVDFGYILEASLASQLCPALCNLMDCSMPGFPVHHQFPELAQTHVHWVDDAIQSSHPLSSPSPPPFNLSQHQDLFQWGSSLHQWPKYWSFSFSISPCNEYSRLISFRIDCFDLLQLRTLVYHLLPTQSLRVIAISFSRGIFLTQGSNLDLLYYRQILNCLSYQEATQLWPSYLTCFLPSFLTWKLKLLLVSTS